MKQRKTPTRLESRLARSAEPLLALARQIAGVETSFVRGPPDEDPLRRGGGSKRSRTFWATPSEAGTAAGTPVCGARQPLATLSPAQEAAMASIADCLQQLFESEREACLSRERGELAEKEASDAREQARQHAAECLHMERLAHTDELTGLLNRRAFMERWRDASARSASSAYPIALIVIDADNFKLVNDTFGHLQGDLVLRAIAATLLEAGRPPDIVARLGGDEFAMVSTHSPTEELVAKAEGIQRGFAVLAAELGVETTLSIGIVTSDECAREDMVAQADLALYRSKAADGNDAEVFLSTMSSFEAHAGGDDRQRRAVR